jgi:sulfate adenylyltransferase subunit 1 (EFTu-like GTPase family)
MNETAKIAKLRPWAFSDFLAHLASWRFVLLDALCALTVAAGMAHSPADVSLKVLPRKKDGIWEIVG